jgi:hypothetical protein
MDAVESRVEEYNINELSISCLYLPYESARYVLPTSVKLHQCRSSEIENMMRCACISRLSTS